MKKNYHLAADVTLDIINGKWKRSILCHLGNQTVRHDEFFKLITGISQKMLTNQLRELEEDQIILRTDFQKFPRHVEYSLTEKGSDLLEILNVMSKWGEKYVQAYNVTEEDEANKINIVNRDQNIGFYS